MKGAASIDGGERNGGDQVERAFDIEEPDQQHRVPRPRHKRRDRYKRQDGGQQIAQCGRIRELQRDAGKDGARRQKHQAEVPERMQQKDGQQYGARLEIVETGRR